MTNNDIEENNSKNDDENIELIINDKNDNDLYNKLIDFKNKNNLLKNKIGMLMKEIQNKNLLIEKLYVENEKNKKIIKKLMKDKQIMAKMNNKILFEKKNLENELFLLQNEEVSNINMNSKRSFKENKFIEEIINEKNSY